MAATRYKWMWRITESVSLWKTNRVCSSGSIEASTLWCWQHRELDWAFQSSNRLWRCIRVASGWKAAACREQAALFHLHCLHTKNNEELNGKDLNCRRRKRHTRLGGFYIAVRRA